MPKIAVIGDVMLDTYHHVNPQRQAPEGGVIQKIQSTEYRPGAGANVADILDKLGWDVSLHAHTGTDQASVILQSWASACQIHTHWNRSNKSFKTRENTRYYHKKNCLLRADMPNSDPRYWPDFPLSLLQDMDAVVLYDKGSLHDFSQDILSYCKKHHIKTFVDPSRSYHHYPQAYLLKANRTEYTAMNTSTGPHENIQDAQSWDHLIITHDQCPIEHRHHGHQTTIEVEPCPTIIDPIGAGDAFLSALITALWENIPMKPSIDIAKKAGALALQHIGTYAPSRSELGLPQEVFRHIDLD